LIYAEGQRRGLELVVDAYEQLGFREDYRNYDDIVEILRDFRVQHLRLLTNNPRKMDALDQAGMNIERVRLVAPTSPHNREELSVKATKLGHLLDGW
jgi:GTP cyclohydrolase II